VGIWGFMLSDKMLEINDIAWNLIIAGHGQNWIPKDVTILFREMWSVDVSPNLISWTSVIASYAQNAHGEGALHILNEMCAFNVKPNLITNASASSELRNNSRNNARSSFVIEMV